MTKLEEKLNTLREIRSEINELEKQLLVESHLSDLSLFGRPDIKIGSTHKVGEVDKYAASSQREIMCEISQLEINSLGDVNVHYFKIKKDGDRYSYTTKGWFGYADA